MTTRSQIVAEARAWIGVNYKRKGRNATGLDCVGLPIKVANALAFTDHDTTDYPDRPDGTFLVRIREVMEAAGGRQKPIAEHADGDLLVFSEGVHVCHCAIRTTDPRTNQPSIVHAHARRRKVVEETIEAARSISGKPVACFEFPVED